MSSESTHSPAGPLVVGVSLRWSKEPPTKPGWYWAREPDSNKPPWIIYIREGYYPAGFYDWADPIREPEAS